MKSEFPTAPHPPGIRGFLCKGSCQAPPSRRCILQSSRKGPSCPPADTGSRAEVQPSLHQAIREHFRVAASLWMAATGHPQGRSPPCLQLCVRPHTGITEPLPGHVGSTSRMPVSAGPHVGGTQVVVPHHPWLHPSLTHSTSAHLVPLDCKENEANAHVCKARGRVGRTFTVSHLALLPPTPPQPPWEVGHGLLLLVS